MSNQRNDGTISLRFLRELVAPCKGSSFDSWAPDPVYVNVAGRLYEVADFSYVTGPYSSHTEIVAGRQVTDVEARAKKERVVIDTWEQARERRR
ncbi:MAG TPA: hypothetical protein VNW90_19170 [Acetobacteraceae bacterium]|nr:hypothetical protein [Acetobacteraceae bacterium]